MVERKLNAAG
jgi:18S rRNA (adenine1779-N6/adenine1780-N6)-dimethyltransferase